MRADEFEEAAEGRCGVKRCQSEAREGEGKIPGCKVKNEAGK